MDNLRQIKGKQMTPLDKLKQKIIASGKIHAEFALDYPPLTVGQLRLWLYSGRQIPIKWVNYLQINGEKATKSIDIS